MEKFLELYSGLKPRPLQTDAENASAVWPRPPRQNQTARGSTSASTLLEDSRETPLLRFFHDIWMKMLVLRVYLEIWIARRECSRNCSPAGWGRFTKWGNCFFASLRSLINWCNYINCINTVSTARWPFSLPFYAPVGLTDFTPDFTLSQKRTWRCLFHAKIWDISSLQNRARRCLTT